ncbi:CHASE3 domain-containing protein [Kallotenue papyrolyticum]|uniref:CHASE3 domain-containing protein n=1 Tax=Kallotenue papyrolyticum TaxID=1325125 RepID=UPI001378A8E3|nr:CHASE3 domain-containing protein [Kallotenue papyrolyticum]
MQWLGNLGIRTKLLLAAWAALTIILLMAGFVFWGVRQGLQREHQVQHTFRVINLADELLLQLVNMETGFRGYLITGADRSLEPYFAGLQRYQELLQIKAQLVSDNPAQLEQLQRIQQTAQYWIDTIARPGIQLRRSASNDSASMQRVRDFINSGVDKQTFDEIRREIAAFREVETQLLEQRAAEAQRAATYLTLSLVGGTGLVLVLSSLGAVVIANSIARRVQGVARAASAMAGGDLTARCPTAAERDEIGQMAEAFNHMAAIIQQRTREIEDQHRALREAHEHQQRLFATVQQLSTPLLPVLEGVVVLPIVGHVDSERAQAIMQTLLRGVAEQRAQVAILDVTGVPAMDAQVVGLLLRAVQATELLGAQVLVVGLSPAMAQALVGQDVDLGALHTQRDLRSALEEAWTLRARWQHERAAVLNSMA